MAFEVQSAESIAVVKVAVEVCNEYELKKEILCAPGSEFTRDKSKYKETLSNIARSIYPELMNPFVDTWKGHLYTNRLWESVIERQAAAILKDGHLTKVTSRKVISIVPAIGRKMLIWALYHESVLGLPRHYTERVSYDSFFTDLGIIDEGKAAKKLISDENLDIKVKYKLACLHCFTDLARGLYNQMTKEEMEEFYDAENPSEIRQPGLVKFWTYSLREEVDKLRGEKTRDEYELEMIVESGSKSAFEHWLKKPGSKENDVIVNAALKTIGRALTAADQTKFPDLNTKNWDWIDFLCQGCYQSDKVWTPVDYYIDVVIFLLSEMNEDQQLQLLKEDIEGAEYGKWKFRGLTYSNVLEFLLNWPYQNHFMKTVGLMWEFLPENSYAHLLLKIMDKIQRVDEYLNYGEEKTYDYMGLFKQFWEQSPAHYKRYVLSDNHICYFPFSTSTVKTCTELLKRLVINDVIGATLPNVSHGYIEMILASATNEERDRIFFSERWTEFCVMLMTVKWAALEQFVTKHLTKEEAEKFKKNFTSNGSAIRACVDLMECSEWRAVQSFIKWTASPEEEAKLRKAVISTDAWSEIFFRMMNNDDLEKLNEFLLKFFQSEERVNIFKREFTVSEEFLYFCLYGFIAKGRFDAADSFLRQSALCLEEVEDLKEKMFSCPEGTEVCCLLFQQDEGAGAVDRFIRWHNPLEEEVKELKKNLIFSDKAIETCAKLAVDKKLELADDFVNYCLSSEEQVEELKTTLAYKEGNVVLQTFLMPDYIHDFFYNTYIEFPGCEWRLAKEFLNWCFSSEEEIMEYKKSVLLEGLGKEVHYNLLIHNQWEEAEYFFSWLHLSSEEIRDLKKNTLFHHLGAGDMFCELLCSEDGDERFSGFGSKQEAIELFLRWYLTDCEAVNEFRDIFYSWNFIRYSEKQIEFLHETFDLAIAQHLSYLEDAEKKSETSEDTTDE